MLSCLRESKDRCSELEDCCTECKSHKVIDFCIIYLLNNELLRPWPSPISVPNIISAVKLTCCYILII